ncbi:anti sigma factor C-terminal domain-containing protein [Priestia taiwanensis]|uniref:Sigma factor regulator C-terminal domain-containing protein n=1 Tax=Priestia taiwanensis TaxID=1347902 RepID=A0A917EQP6_9BACI|nr:anti sigma factor C-terminal domain-containing protein [Priestia taiwanensis]MBM7363526.1 hypothetical protein [Priestia taiwanensis]GGE76393.1 hypothetical protein GCM10007140_27650 [Priestia taiwanensis]
MEEDKVPFELEDKKVKQMLRKARWKAIVKYSGIALAVMLIGIILISTILTRMISNYAEEVLADMRKKENEIINTLTSEYELGHPNTEYDININNYQPKDFWARMDSLGIGAREVLLERFWEKREVVAISYKVIEGILIPWKEEMYQYSESQKAYFPKVSHSIKYGEDATTFQLDKDKSTVYSLETKQREMQFYHHDKQYDMYPNDLERISKYENKVMEVALSFDKSYLLEEVKKMLPADVTQVWYWVDTPLDSMQYYDNPPIYPIWDKYVMGFDVTKTEEGFIEEIRIAKGKKKAKGDGSLRAFHNMAGVDDFRHYAEDVYDELSRGKVEPGKEDIRIIGAVVTGDEKRLQSLQGLPFVKAISLGAVADKNQ